MQAKERERLALQQRLDSAVAAHGELAVANAGALARATEAEGLAEDLAQRLAVATSALQRLDADSGADA